MPHITRKEQEAAYEEAIRAGLLGGIKWFLLGMGASLVAQKTWPAYQRLTLPFKTFLVCSATTWGIVVAADHKMIEEARKKATMRTRQNPE
ncbi:uncharacterized protein VTP21DRAFT_9576 [Calcarisporiella thermophila]|uniref:uncharacterized protein n=1 Tax=Calcarisporiella thermophila TaxID=911321 RepID=UPI00374406FA